MIVTSSKGKESCCDDASVDTGSTVARNSGWTPGEGVNMIVVSFIAVAFMEIDEFMHNCTELPTHLSINIMLSHINEKVTYVKLLL